MTEKSVTIDPLLECLVFLTSHYGRARSAQALVAGLAYGDSNMRPALFCEAAERIDLKAQIVKQDKLKKIQSAVLPVVLILKEGQACVLLKRNKDEHSATIWSPETSSERSVLLTDLKQSYEGYAIYVHPKPEFNDAQAPHLEDSNRHWFWGPLLDCKSIYMRAGVRQF